MPAALPPTAPPPTGLPAAACQPVQHARAIAADENAWDAARSFAHQIFGDKTGDLLTVTDELVVNAVKHARDTTSIGVCFRQLPDGVLVEVADGDRNPPAPRQAADFDGSGRGLAIVAGLSLRWGWRLEKRGKVVYAVISLEER